MLRIQRQPRWLLGVFLVLAFLGHDALMAAPAHAAPAPAAPKHASAHQETASPADEHHPSHPTHPTTCGVAGVAAPSPGYQLDLDNLPLLEAIAAPDLRAVARPPVQHWDEPFWPPGALRALLQVYRI